MAEQLAQHLTQTLPHTNVDTKMFPEVVFARRDCIHLHIEQGDSNIK